MNENLNDDSNDNNKNIRGEGNHATNVETALVAPINESSLLSADQPSTSASAGTDQAASANALKKSSTFQQIRINSKVFF